MKLCKVYLDEPTKTIKIKDGYISFIRKDGMSDCEHFGGFVLINDKPKQVKFTKAELLKEVKILKLRGCIIGIIEICTYAVGNDKYAELIDPIKRDYLH